MSTTRPNTKNAFKSSELKFLQGSRNALQHVGGLAFNLNVGLSNFVDPHSMPKEWSDSCYRKAAMEATVEGLIAWGLRVNREERGIKQSELAAIMCTGQSAVSKLEDPEGGDVQLSTLFKAAHALELALLVKFVDYGEFAAQTRDVSPERLYAAPFTEPSTTPMEIKHGND